MGEAQEAEGNSLSLLAGGYHKSQSALWTFAWAFVSVGEGPEEMDAPLKNTSVRRIKFILSLDSGLRQQQFQSVFLTSLLLIGNGNRG